MTSINADIQRACLWVNKGLTVSVRPPLCAAVTAEALLFVPD